MRLVQVTVPAGRRDGVLGVLDDEGIDYSVVDEASHRGYTAVITFPLPPPAVEPVLDKLREVGVTDNAITVVLDAETVVSHRFETLVERYEEDQPDRIARPEIQARARELTPDFYIYIVLTIVSVVIATAGVLLDSAAVVVGSMVIAPLIGPAMATSVGTVIADDSLFVRGVRFQAAGFAISLAAAMGFSLLVQVAHLIPPGTDIMAIGQVRERLAPDFLSLAVALGAGTAGALSLSTGVSASLVGVMIAVALVPPVAVAGVGMAWGAPTVVVGAVVLALVNFLSINLAAIAVFWYQGYRPAHWYEAEAAATAVRRRIAVLGVAILLLSVFLGLVTYASYQTATFESEVRDDVEAVLAGSSTTLIDLDFEYEGTPPLRQPTRVVVTVGHASGSDPPALVEPLDQRIDARADRDVRVEVRYVAVDESG